MTYYYVHDESSCAFLSNDPPEVVMGQGDGCVELTDRTRYLIACESYGQRPEPHPDPCHETRLRIRVAAAAYAYEIENDPIMSDAEFDRLALEIDIDRSTANSEMDAWFIVNFSPHTGSWVHGHPGLAGLAKIYRLLRRGSPLKRFPTPEQRQMLDEPLFDEPLSGQALLIWMCAP